jgi:hypothetical protein
MTLHPPPQTYPSPRLQGIEAFKNNMFILNNKMPIVLNADDIKFLTGEDTKVEVSEDLVLSYIRQARKMKSQQRYKENKSEYNKRYNQKLAERLATDPAFKEQYSAKRRAYHAKKKAEREAKE